jgi:predicted nucleotidyltransferase
MSISQSFSKLIDRIQPTTAEVNSAKQHLSVIKTRLETVFDMSSCRVTGSFSRDTSIHSFSDIDLFAAFRKGQFTRGGSIISSTQILDNIRRELLTRYPSTPLGKDGMAITIKFSDGQIVDVVPALFDSMFKEKWPVYLIPDGAGGWMHSSPSLYNAYIKQADEQSGGKLKYIAQLMKFWRDCRKPRIPISSFHIEMILASEAICKGVKSYSECFRDLLRNLSERNCRAIHDPYQIGGYIPAVKSANQLDFAFASVRHCRDHANNAVSTESYDEGEARRQWKIVFNENFPN